MAFMCAKILRDENICIFAGDIGVYLLPDLLVAVEKSLQRFYFLFQGVFLGLAKCVRLRSIKSSLWMPTDSMSVKRCSLSPDQMQHNIVTPTLPWPVYLILPWINYNERTTEVPDQLHSLWWPGSEKGQDQVMHSKMQNIHILKYPREELFSLNSWADARVLPGSLYTLHRGRNTRDCVLLSVPGPSPPDAGACAFLQPHSTPDHWDSQWQKSLLLGKVIFSSHF